MSNSTSRFFSFLFLGASLLRDVAVKTMEDVKTLLLEISTVVRTVHSIFHEYCDVLSEKLKLKLSFECNNTFFLEIFIARIITNHFFTLLTLRSFILLSSFILSHFIFDLNYLFILFIFLLNLLLYSFFYHFFSLNSL